MIPFRPRHVATVRGKLAESAPKAGDVVRGVLVQQAGQAADMQLLHPDELSKFTKLAQGVCVWVMGFLYSGLRWLVKLLGEGERQDTFANLGWWQTLRWLHQDFCHQPFSATCVLLLLSLITPV
jgi:hypothetical protein